MHVGVFNLHGCVYNTSFVRHEESNCALGRLEHSGHINSLVLLEICFHVQFEGFLFFVCLFWIFKELLLFPTNFSLKFNTSILEIHS